jgi:prepilin signal peptidase PulO-like enzyme (type II secretory pathway)
MITILFLIWIFILGAVIGSFLNVIILRHEAGERPTGRSRCPHCNTTLTARELIPVLSYAMQRGKCRTCGIALSPQYPLVELLTAVVFTLVAYAAVATGMLTLELYQAPSLALGMALTLFALHLAIWATLIVITVYDLRTKLIPDVFSFTFIGLAFLVMVLNAEVGMWTLLAGPLFYLPYWVLWRVSEGRWIGLGDAKLSWGIAWFLGPALGGTAILFAFWIGAICSLSLIGIQRVMEARARSKKGNALTLKSEVPFGPYLVLGTLIVYLTQFDLFAYLLIY